jgi:hypothetical protein
MPGERGGGGRVDTSRPWVAPFGPLPAFMQVLQQSVSSGTPAYSRPKWLRHRGSLTQGFPSPSDPTAGQAARCPCTARPRTLNWLAPGILPSSPEVPPAPGSPHAGRNCKF